MIKTKFLTPHIGLIAVLICSQASYAQPRNDTGESSGLGASISQSVKSVGDRVQRDLQDWNIGDHEGVTKAKADIRDKFGLTVGCGRGFLGMWSALSNNDCLSGLVRLEAGLGEMGSKLDRKYLENVTVELGPPGMWQGLTILDRQIKVPFNANPRVQATFIADEIALLYQITLKQLTEQNAQYAKKIADTYFISVGKDPTVDVYQYHDGLKKAELTAMLIYAGQKPSREIAQSLGFDRLVVSKADSDLYESNGELAIDFDYADHPGAIFDHILKSVKNSNGGGWFSYLKGKDWSWGQVVKFRRDRARANELKNTLSQNLNKPVDCMMDTQQQGYIGIADCREGLEKVRMAMRSDALQLPGDINQIVITDLGMMHNYEVDPQTRSLLIDYNANSAKIAEALGHK